MKDEKIYLASQILFFYKNQTSCHRFCLNAEMQKSRPFLISFWMHGQSVINHKKIKFVISKEAVMLYYDNKLAGDIILTM